MLKQRLNRAILFVLVATIVYAFWYAFTPVAVRNVPVEFEIPAGSGLRAAVGVLEKAGIAVGGTRFELLARALGHSKDIRAGNYQILHPVTPMRLLDRLSRGDVMQSEITLIEGWNLREMRAALDAQPDLRHDTKGLTEEQLLAKVGAKELHAEGLFFPDTYLFAKGSSDLAVLRRAYHSMQRHLKAEWKKRDPNVPYHTAYQALIMASIIEKETGRPDERRLIGSALTNRLRIGMRLQVDPTVIYGLGPSFSGNLTKADLLTDGPYNTYTRSGLPPTPIAMPGLASLQAALRPAKSDALYYVARGDGTSEFSRTLHEHNRAVNRYQLSAGRRAKRGEARRE